LIENDSICEFSGDFPASYNKLKTAYFNLSTGIAISAEMFGKSLVLFH
jgi:hypothetical protein